MSASDNLSKDQFKDHIEVYRGLYGVAPHEVNTESLGVHWSSNPHVAESFAYPEEMGPGHHGTIITGLVHPKHIEKDFNKLNVHGALEHDSPELEHFVKPGSPVHVTSLRHFQWDSDDHQNVQKEMKA